MCVFPHRGIGKQGFQCQGMHQYAAAGWLFHFADIDFISSLSSSSVQLCGPQTMSRVCDLHMSRLGRRPQTRREQMCLFFLLPSEVLGLCLCSGFTVSSPSHLAMGTSPVTCEVAHLSVGTSPPPRSLVLPVRSPLRDTWRVREMGWGGREAELGENGATSFSLQQFEGFWVPAR